MNETSKSAEGTAPFLGIRIDIEQTMYDNDHVNDSESEDLIISNLITRKSTPGTNQSKRYPFSSPASSRLISSILGISR